MDTTGDVWYHSLRLPDCHPPSLPSQLYLYSSPLILYHWLWPGGAGLWAVILSICCKTKPWCSVMRRTTWWRKWKMMTNMRDSYGLIKIDREATRFVIVSATQSVQRERRSFPLQVYKLNWNILLSVSCSFVKVDGPLQFTNSLQGLVFCQQNIPGRRSLEKSLSGDKAAW